MPLTREEEKITKKKALELFDTGKIAEMEVGTFEGLRKIHAHLFGEVYDFAGKLRTVNIAKGNFRFVPVLYLEAALAKIDAMPEGSFEEIVEKYVEMNIAHPFREGNGRSTRLWLDCILKERLGKVLDWSRIPKEDYLFAMERSPIRDVEIKHLLRGALTEEISDRAVYMKGLDQSYFYEGYSEYTTEEL